MGIVTKNITNAETIISENQRSSVSAEAIINTSNHSVTKVTATIRMNLMNRCRLFIGCLIPLFSILNVVVQCILFSFLFIKRIIEW